MPRNNKFKINDIHIREPGMTVKSETVTVDLDPDKLGAPVAEAIALAIQRGIKGIREVASAATLARSKRRQSGRQSPRKTPYKFNDTGRLADDLGLRRDSEGNWSIGAPRDRLVGKTANLLERLVELVPVLENPAKLFRDPSVRKAQEEAARGMFSKARLR